MRDDDQERGLEHGLRRLTTTTPCGRALGWLAPARDGIAVLAGRVAA